MTDTFAVTRDRLETYFNRTASKAWEVLSTDVPVSPVRTRVRLGRQEMKNILLNSIPSELSGARVLDAGCGTGELSVQLASRGAEVLGVDISRKLIDVANKRLPINLKQKVNYCVGDMLSENHGSFDFVLAMDSLIHYDVKDIAKAIGTLELRTSEAISFTVAPKTLLLSILLSLGKALPRANRSPNIAPVNFQRLHRELKKFERLSSLELTQIKRVKASFYVSEAINLRK